MDNRKRVVILARASSGKQIIKGDTLDDQIDQCTDHAKEQNWRIIKIFPLCESGSIVERMFFQEVLDYCKNPLNKVDYILFKNINRFTRGGEGVYLDLKKKLECNGVELRDIYGTIRPKVNTMAKFGLEYSWSVYSPSQSEETYQASRAKDFVRDSMTQMIGAEVIYTNKGYWCRNAPFGFVKRRIETSENGERVVLDEHPTEGFLIKKMYEMLDYGYLENEVVVELNNLGFKTRKFCKRDKKTKKVIGYGGENPLEVEHLRELVTRPIYAGIICEKWTKKIPIKAQFNGLVSIEVFNRVNAGKRKIIELPNGQYQIKYGKEQTNDRSIKRRLKDNPLYPFKGEVLCPVCKSSLSASASKGKAGTKYPAYHHSKEHKLWRIPREEFHKTVYDFIRKIKFNQSFAKLFEEVFLNVWKNKRVEAIEASKKAEEYVAELLTKQKGVLDTIKSVTMESVRKQLERDYDDLENQIKDARSNRVEKEKEEIDIKLAIHYAVHFMEHLEDLLIDEANPLQQRQLFGLLFEEKPTYDDLVSGTPILSCYFELITNPNLSKSELAPLAGLEPTTSTSATSCSIRIKLQGQYVYCTIGEANMRSAVNIF